MPTNITIQDSQLGEVPFTLQRTLDPNKDSLSQLTAEERRRLSDDLKVMRLTAQGPSISASNLPNFGGAGKAGAAIQAEQGPGFLKRLLSEQQFKDQSQVPPVDPGLRRGINAGLAATAVGASGGTLAPMMLAAGGGSLASDLLAGSENPLRNARDEMLLEGAPMLTIGALRGTLFRSLGKNIPEDMRVAAAGAEELGIPLGVENVVGTERGIGRFVRGTRNIIGRLPFFGKPFKTADTAQVKGIREARDTLMDGVAPIVRTVAETGVDLSSSALRRAKLIGEEFNRLYTQVLNRADASGALVPTEALRRAARGIVDELQKLPRRPGQGGALQPIGMPGPTAFDDSIIQWAKNDLLAIEAEITPTQFKSLTKGLNRMIQKAQAEGASDRFGHLTVLRSAMEEDFGHIVGPDAITRQLRGLDASFRQWAELMEGATAQRINRGTRGFGKFLGEGRQTKEADELFPLVFNMKSPEAMQELHRLVGTGSFRAAIGAHVEGVMKKAFKGGDVGDDLSPIRKRSLIDFDKLQRELGLGKSGSPERAAFAKALKLAGSESSVGDFEKFFNAAQLALSQNDTDVAALLARRLALGLCRRLSPPALESGPGTDLRPAGAHCGSDLYGFKHGGCDRHTLSQDR